MKYRIDKKSGNKLSALGLGCMRFPSLLGVIDMRKTEDLIKRAIEGGVNYFDTAWFYPGSEEALGAVLEKNSARKNVYIATKLPLVFLKSGADFDKIFNKQLARLRTDYIDYYLLHSLADMNQLNLMKKWGIEEWLEEKKKQGRIRQAGFSFHGQRDEFLKIIDNYDWDMCMIQYNYSDENYQAGITGLKKAAEKMPVIIMEPLLGGKLATGLPKEAVNVFRQANPDISPAGRALSWLWNQEEVTQVLSGMSTVGQLEENLRLAETAYTGMLGEADHEAYRKVMEIVNRTFKIRCTSCNYCMPCPKGVNIPGSFSAYNTSFSLGYMEGFRQFLMSTGTTVERSGSPGRCSKCGKCEPLCPQHLPIMRDLDTVRKRMEPFLFRFILKIATLFTGNKGK